MIHPVPTPGEEVEPARAARKSPDIPVEAIVAWVVRNRVAVAIAAGVLFRLVAYFSNRHYWMDEAALVGNIDQLSPREFFGPLIAQQLAPPAFLVSEWVAGFVFGHNRPAMRLVPLLGGIASLFLFLGVARRCLPDRAVFPAVLMFAMCSDLIYFASEAKQYSTDVTSMLACLLLGLTIGSRRLTISGATVLGIWGVAIVWFSHTSIFGLASVGVVGLARSIAAKDRRWAALWVAVGVAWVATYGTVLAVGMRQLGGGDGMWRFWDFAFPPMPPRSVWDATWVVRHLAYYFINPLNFDVPFGERLSMLPAIALALIGVFRLWKFDRARFALLMLPVAFALLASSLKLYPFHGRLILFLITTPLIAIAAGLEWVREARGRGLLHFALATMVLVVPTAVACYRAVDPVQRHYNRFGDLRPETIDPYRFPS